ncbi:PREDICTED: uncharacterized protein LOC109154673 [Ipomoea nil]|uniref:uncharacterized protein LOC109154673 n=1 Tax=Ipomoea nil TaxID=35883 RepID=UPI00090162A2|nr:PREDICTED: uncharacterized protein LOC109154673 [Ipomoea nil]
MSPWKAPGPDGLHAAFYQSTWDVVGDSVHKLVRNAFVSWKLPLGVNETILALIPKIGAPETIKQFRPIRLCNESYKIITKTITNRLKAILPKLVGPFQSSFVPGRQISDNVIIYQELMHSMRVKKGKKGLMAIKIDLEKAYGHLSWNFIIDTLLDAEASVEQLSVIQQCLSRFCEASGQKISLSKSQVFFSRNTSPDVATAISATLNIPVTTNLGRYLGVPSVHGRVTQATFSRLLDRVMMRLEGWRSKTLSFARRVAMAKTVLSAIPMYTMKTTNLPKGVCKKLEMITRRFIWSGDGETRRVSLVAWVTMTRPPADGRLGLCRIEDVNSAFMAKLGWRILTERDSLWT